MPPMPPPIRILVAITFQTYPLEDSTGYRQRNLLVFHPPPGFLYFVTEDRFVVTGFAPALAAAFVSFLVGGSDHAGSVEVGHGGELDGVV